MKPFKRFWTWCEVRSEEMKIIGAFALAFALVFPLAYLLITPFHLSGIYKYVIISLIDLSIFLPISIFFLCLGYITYQEITIVWKLLKTNPQIIGNQFLSSIKDNALLIALVFIYVFFYRFWENWIENHLIAPFLCHFESDLLKDIIFILATIFCLVLLYVKLFNVNYRRTKRVKQQTLILSIIAIIVWAYYRFYGICGMYGSLYYMYLKPLSILKPIKYFDIVFVVAIYNIMSYAFNKVDSLDPSVHHFDATKGLRRNVPIVEKEDDFLERDELAKSVVGELLVTDASKSSFTFGIDAPWGSGKTSFINLMKNHLESDKNIIIDFNPWSYSANKDLVGAFFDELSKTLKQYDTSLAKNMIDYSKLLSAFDTAETKLISSLLELSRNDDSSLQVKKQQISEAIKRINRRIMVFIDDLDRLEANEILEMMKLIRNVSDFPYMYIIAAYDKSYVVRCLTEKMKSGATNFVEKIFEHEHILAPCSNESLRRSLVTQLALINNGEFLQPALENYILDNKNKALNALSNLRELYRLSNNIASADSLLNHENVYSIDLLLFGLFKTKYPVAFSLFEHKLHEVLVENTSHKYYELFCGTDDDGHFNFIQYLDSHQEEMCLNKFEIKTIRLVLSELFKENKNVPEKVPCLNQIKWFNRYLNLTQLESDIDENEFHVVMKETIDKIKKAFDDWSVDKSVSLKYRLLNHDKGKRLGHEQLKKLIEVLIYASIKNDWNIYFELNVVISHLKRFNRDTFSRDDHRFIKNLLINSCYSDFISKYVGYLYKQKEYKKTPLSETDLIDVQQRIFKDCCKENQDGKIGMKEVFRCFSSLLGDYNNHIYFSPIFRENHDEYTKSLVTAMKTLAESNKKEFLQSVIQLDEETGRIYYVYPFVKYLWPSWRWGLWWGSWRGFQQFLSKLDESDPFCHEFKEFFKQYKKNHYKFYVDKKYNHISMSTFT